MTYKWVHVIHIEAINHEIDPETLGQLTGLLDKNGKEIWEGDVVKGSFDIRTGTRVSTYKRTKNSFAVYTKMDVVGEVIFSNQLSAFYFNTNFKQEYKSNFWRGLGSTASEKKANEWTSSYDSPADYLHKVLNKIEVIGDIYQTTELLKQKNPAVTGL